ncbi:MAG: N-acetylneuraminate synthase family protein [Pirellulales bacterium]
MVGFSDHTLGTVVATAAVALGALIVEKHLTLDRTLKGTDHACSAEPQELHELVNNLRRVEAALGRADKPATGAMVATRRKLGRSVVSRMPLIAGTVLDESMVTLKSPGEGVLDRSLAFALLRPQPSCQIADELLLPSDVG